MTSSKPSLASLCFLLACLCGAILLTSSTAAAAAAPAAVGECTTSGLPQPPPINDSSTCMTTAGLEALAMHMDPSLDSKGQRLLVDSALAFLVGESLAQRLLWLKPGASNGTALNHLQHQTRSPASNGFNAPDLNTFVSTAVIDVSGSRVATFTVPHVNVTNFYAVALSDLYLDALGSFTSAQAVPGKAYSIVGPGASAAATKTADFVSPTNVVVLQIFIALPDPPLLPPVWALQQQFKVHQTTGPSTSLRARLQQAGELLVAGGYDAGSAGALSSDSIASKLSALSLLFRAVPPPARADIHPLLKRLRAAGLDLTSGKAVSFQSGYAPDEAAPILAGAVLAQACALKVQSNNTVLEGTWMTQEAYLEPYVKRAVYALNEAASPLGTTTFASSIFGGPQTLYAFQTYNVSGNSTYVNPIGALGTYEQRMHNASANFSAWSISVFDTNNRRLNQANSLGTFGPMGAADPSALQVVQLSAVPPAAGNGTNGTHGWIPISGGVIVLLRVYPLAFGGFFKTEGGSGRRLLQTQSLNINICINNPGACPNTVIIPKQGVVPMGNQIAWGIGYNAVNGWPILGGPSHGPAPYLFDFGITGQQVFNLTTSTAPYQPPTNGCANSLTSYSYQTSSSYNFNAAYSLSAGGKLWPVSFSASTQFQWQQNYQSSSELAVTLSLAQCVLQTYEIYDPNSGWILSDAFNSSTVQLIQTYQANTANLDDNDWLYAVTSWVAHWGTSYISLAAYGGIAQIQTYSTGQQFNEATTTNVNAQATSKFFGLQGSASGSSTASSSDSSSATYTASYSTCSPANPAPTPTGSGASTTIDTNTWTAQLATAAPNLIAFETNQLTSLFTPKFFPMLSVDDLIGAADAVASVIAGCKFINNNQLECMGLSDTCPSFSTTAEGTVNTVTGAASCINCGTSGTTTSPAPSCNPSNTVSCTSGSCQCKVTSQAGYYVDDDCTLVACSTVMTSTGSACSTANTASCTATTCTCKPGFAGYDCTAINYGSCTGYYHDVQNCYNNFNGCTYGYYRMSNTNGHDVYCTCCTDATGSDCGIGTPEQGYGKGYWGGGSGAVVCGDCCVDDNCNDNSYAQGKISGSCSGKCCHS